MLDLANEDLRTGADLRRLLERHGSLEEAARQEVSFRLPEFIDLARSLRELLEASIGGGPFPAAAVERLNEASARVPVARRFDPPDVVERPVASGPTAQMLADIARSAITLLGTERRARLRRCEACERFFIATRTDRRWCSTACGNRTRVARHHARRRVGPVADSPP